MTDLEMRMLQMFFAGLGVGICVMGLAYEHTVMRKLIELISKIKEPSNG
ncbi:MAG: hypothetical protein WC023_06295 [Rhodocyclaceae bacterium]